MKTKTKFNKEIINLEEWKDNRKEPIGLSEIWLEKAKWISNRLIVLETSLKLREDKQVLIKMESEER